MKAILFDANYCVGCEACMEACQEKNSLPKDAPRGLSAARYTSLEDHDDVYLRDHETVRYRVDIDYGIGTEADVDIYVRGFISPPRVRVLDSDYDEVKDKRDTNGDWTLDFDFTAKDHHSKYYVEVSGSTKATIENGKIYKSGSTWATVAEAQRTYDCDPVVAGTLWVLQQIGQL